MSENVVWVTCQECKEAIEVPLELLPDGKDPGTWVCEECDGKAYSEIGEPGEFWWDDEMDEETEDDLTFDGEDEEEAKCTICGRGELLNSCEVCGQWTCNECIIRSGVEGRKCPWCVPDKEHDEFPF